MRRTLAALPLALLPCLLLGQQPAAPAAPAAPRLDTARIDSIVAAGMSARHLVGVSVGIQREGGAVFVRGYGTASLATHAPVDTTTRFAIGSVTKQFICVLILKLQAEGKLSVDDRVAKYFPDLTRANDITLRDLMGHVSGYPDYYPLDFVDRRMLRPIAGDSLARWYGHQPLDFEPGTRWSYSNTGFIILGRVAEIVTGRGLGRLLQQYIFSELAMTHTTFEPARLDASYAQGYAWFALGAPEPAEPEGRGWAGAAGAIWSTPGDLLLWDSALMNLNVLGLEDFRAMTTPRVLRGGASTGYGYGLSIGQFNGDTIFSHGGAVSGFAAQNTMVPRVFAAVVVLSNAEASVSSGPLVRMAVTSRPPPPPPSLPPARAGAPTPSAPAPAAATPASDPRPVPDVAGPLSTELATTLFRQIQSGQLDRSLLGEEFSWWLTAARLRGAKERLAPLGDATRIDRLSRGERGGMEVTVTRFTFPSRALTALMYRTPDGKVQEFLIREQ